MTDATIADGPSDEALRGAKVATLDTVGCTLAADGITSSVNPAPVLFQLHSLETVDSLATLSDLLRQASR